MESLHEMSKPVFWEKIIRNDLSSPAELAMGVVMVNNGMFFLPLRML